MAYKLKKYAGLFDKPSNILSNDIWDGFQLKSGVKAKILDRLNEVLPYPINIFSSITLIGSMLTYQYSPTSDIDVGVQLKEEYDDMQPDLHQIFKNTNGWDLPGTAHPVNFFVSTSTRMFRPENMTAGYDLLNDVWIKKATKPTNRDMRRYDMDMPYLNLKRHALGLQLDQLRSRPSEKEELDVARIYQMLDQERKQGYEYPGVMGGTKSLSNATYKYTLKPYDEEIIEALYHKLKSLGLTFRA